MFSGIWRKAKKKNMKKERKFGLKEFPRPLHCRNGGGHMETGKEKIQPVITGTFPAQRFFDTLAAILSRRENVSITVKVTQEEKQKTAV